jgi:glycine oxidase
MTDVLIAGGGIIGASIAWRLARQGLSVTLCDAAHIGAEASSAAAGMLSVGGEFDAPSSVLEFAIASLARYAAFTNDLEIDSGLPIEFRETGAVQIALTSADLDMITKRAAFQRSVGIASSLLTADELRSVAPAVRPNAIGAVHYPNDATVDPAGLMRALRAACLARGVSLNENSRVTSIAATNAGIRACLSDKSIEARSAVIAAGSWSSSIAVTIDSRAYALPRSFPIKGHLLGYRLPPGSVPATIRHEHTYILQRSDGFTIAGSSTEDLGYDRTIDDRMVLNISRRAGEIVPAIGSLEPESVWIGFRPGCDSAAPQIARLQSSSLWTAYGHYRNGILLAPATADLVSQQIAGALNNSRGLSE